MQVACMVLYVPMNYSTEIDGQSQTADDIRPARDIGYSAVPEPWSSAVKRCTIIEGSSYHWTKLAHLH